jgi:hypothetical protein
MCRGIHSGHYTSTPINSRTIESCVKIVNYVQCADAYGKRQEKHDFTSREFRATQYNQEREELKQHDYSFDQDRVGNVAKAGKQ